MVRHYPGVSHAGGPTSRRASTGPAQAIRGRAMRHRRILLLSLAILLASPAARLRADGPAPLPDFTPWDVPALDKAPAFEWLDRSGKVHSLLYEAEPYRGKKTRVFAYYASPATLGIAGGEKTRFP